ESARPSYGTRASSKSREPPGTRSSSAIAPLPPPVMASTTWRPDACIAAIVCRHAASDMRSAPLPSKINRRPRPAGPQPRDGLQRVLQRTRWWKRFSVESTACYRRDPLELSWRRAMRIRLFFSAALAVLLLTATAPALEPPTFSNEVVRILQARCQTCHRPGEHAPFPLLTYHDAFDKKDD